MREATQISGEKTLRDYIDILMRRRYLILAAVLAALAIAVAYILATPPVFQSVTRLLIQDRKDAVTRRDAGDPFSDIYVAPPWPNVVTQVEVLKGEDILKKAHKSTKVPEGAVTLEVKRVLDTDVVEIVVKSHSPEFAQRIANAMPTTYTDYAIDHQKEGVSQALSYARKRLATANKQLAEAEVALQRFRDRNRVTNLDKQRETRITQSAELQRQVSDTSTTLQGLESQLAQNLKYRNSQPTYIETPVSTTNASINVIKDQIAALRNQRASLSVLYKPTHAKIQEVDAQIRSLESQLKQTPATTTITTRTPNPVVTQYNDKIAATRAELAAKKSELAEARRTSASVSADLQRFNEIERQESALQRTAERLNNTVALLSRSVDSLEIQERATQNPTVTVTSGTPARQVAPRTVPVLLAALMGGLLLGILLALLQSQLDTRVESGRDVQRILPAPVLGSVPMLKGSDNLYLSHDNTSPALESVRVLRTNLEVIMERHGLKSVLLTSTTAGEGKSLTALNLAIAFAMDDRRVILVDTDLRAPSLSQEFGVPSSFGLTNVLFGHIPVEYALQSTPVPGLTILAAGVQPSRPSELLNSRSMRKLHEELKDRADVVIFDGPPMLAGADAQVLAAQADATLLVVEMGEATKPALSYATDLLKNVHARLLGIVLNKVRQELHPYGEWSYTDAQRKIRRRSLGLGWANRDHGSENGSILASSSMTHEDGNLNDTPVQQASISTPNSWPPGAIEDERR